MSQDANKDGNKTSWLRIILVIVAFLTSILGILTGANNNSGEDFYSFKNNEEVTGTAVAMVTYVIDGDTVEVEDINTGEVFRVRYLGVDTPEMDGEDYETCFADEAKDRNEELVLDEKVMLEFDKDKYDQYGRTLAYVYTLDLNGKKDVFVNLNLLEEGYGRFYLDKQNTLYQEDLMEGALAGQEDYEGLWGSCGEDRFDNDCMIKGNVDVMGAKYYHLPDDKYYDDTIVNLDKEDQWLCTIEEAETKSFERANELLQEE
jgi:endonuclease YncB( thermonuclease family)